MSGSKHRVDLTGLVAPGLGHHLFSASQAAKTGLATIIDSRPHLEQDHHVLPLQQLSMNQHLLYFDLDIVNTSEPTSDTTTALSASQVPAEPADIWHRRNGTRQLLKFEDSARRRRQ